MGIFNQFCQKSDGSSNTGNKGRHYSKCDKLDILLFDNQDECDKYKTIWNDHKNLIYLSYD